MAFHQHELQLWNTQRKLSIRLVGHVWAQGMLVAVPYLPSPGRQLVVAACKQLTNGDWTALAEASQGCHEMVECGWGICWELDISIGHFAKWLPLR